MKIAVAMSGGVDSSAAAAILKEQGHELVGFTMQLWDQRRGINVDENGDPLSSRCCSLDDVYDARRVAEELGFSFYVLNLERDFERDVEREGVTVPALALVEQSEWVAREADKLPPGRHHRPRREGERPRRTRGPAAPACSPAGCPELIECPS